MSLYRHTDPDTSRIYLSADRTTQIQRDILNYMRRYPGGVTDMDIQNFFGNHGATYRTRRKELVDKGLITDSGIRMRQEGRRRILWVLNG